MWTPEDEFEENTFFNANPEISWADAAQANVANSFNNFAVGSLTRFARTSVQDYLAKERDEQKISWEQANEQYQLKGRNAFTPDDGEVFPTIAELNKERQDDENFRTMIVNAASDQDNFSGLSNLATSLTAAIPDAALFYVAGAAAGVTGVSAASAGAISKIPNLHRVAAAYPKLFNAGVSFAKNFAESALIESGAIALGDINYNKKTTSGEYLENIMWGTFLGGAMEYGLKGYKGSFYSKLSNELELENALDEALMSDVDMMLTQYGDAVEEVVTESNLYTHGAESLGKDANYNNIHELMERKLYFESGDEVYNYQPYNFKTAKNFEGYVSLTKNGDFKQAGVYGSNTTVTFTDNLVLAKNLTRYGDEFGKAYRVDLSELKFLSDDYLSTDPEAIEKMSMLIAQDAPAILKKLGYGLDSIDSFAGNLQTKLNNVFKSLDEFKTINAQSGKESLLTVDKMYKELADMLHVFNKNKYSKDKLYDILNDSINRTTDFDGVARKAFSPRGNNPHNRFALFLNSKNVKTAMNNSNSIEFPSGMINESIEMPKYSKYKKNIKNKIKQTVDETISNQTQDIEKFVKESLPDETDIPKKMQDLNERLDAENFKKEVVQEEGTIRSKSEFGLEESIVDNIGDEFTALTKEQLKEYAHHFRRVKDPNHSEIVNNEFIKCFFKG